MSKFLPECRTHKAYLHYCTFVSYLRNKSVEFCTSWYILQPCHFCGSRVNFYWTISLDICTHIWIYVFTSGYLQSSLNICIHLWIFPLFFEYLCSPPDICNHLWIYVFIFGCFHSSLHICDYLWIFALRTNWGWEINNCSTTQGSTSSNLSSSQLRLHLKYL